MQYNLWQILKVFARRLKSSGKFLVGFLTVSLLFFVLTNYGVVAQPPKKPIVTAATRTVYGEEARVGNGKVRTWVKLDNKSGEPVSIGVSMTEAALTGLPSDTDQPQENSLKLRLMDGGPNNTFEYQMLFPKEAEETAFRHMGFNWNPEGHGPTGIFTKAHFDVHFYMATPEYRHGIFVDLGEGSQANIRLSNLEPPDQFLPPDYKLAPNTAEPRMGSHYADMTSSQLKPGNFSNIFLIGAHGGNILFWEPMITKAYLETKPNFTTGLKLPESYPVSGYYPTAYSIIYNQKRKEFDISLDGLAFRLASYPKNVYGVEACMDSRVAQMIAKFGRIPNNPATKRCVDVLQGALKK